MHIGTGADGPMLGAADCMYVPRCEGIVGRGTGCILPALTVVNVHAVQTAGTISTVLFMSCYIWDTQRSEYYPCNVPS